MQNHRKNAVGKYELTEIRISLLPKLNATFDIDILKIIFQRKCNGPNVEPQCLWYGKNH